MLSATIRRPLLSLAVLFLATCYTPLLRKRGILVDLIVAVTVRIQTFLTRLGFGDREIMGNLKCIEENFPSKSRSRQRVLKLIQGEHEGATQWNRFVSDPEMSIPVSISGQQHLDEQIASGKGAILLCYHFDLYRMIPAVLYQHGFEIVVHKEQAGQFNGRVWRWVSEHFANRRYREMKQSPIDFEYHSDNVTLARLGRKLRKGKSVIITGDGLSGKSFVQVPFFDRKIYFPKGPAQFAAIMQVPILPVFLYGPSQEGTTSRLEIYSPIVVDGPSEESLEEAIVQCTAILEKSVEKSPCLWSAWSRCYNFVPE